MVKRNKKLIVWYFFFNSFDPYTIGVVVNFNVSILFGLQFFKNIINFVRAKQLFFYEELFKKVKTLATTLEPTTSRSRRTTF